MWTVILNRMLAQLIRQGTLILHFPDGTTQRHGDGSLPSVSVRLTDPAVIARLVRNPDLALGEAYVAGHLTIDADDLRGLLALVIANTKGGGPLVWWRRIQDAVRVMLRGAAQFNSANRSAANVEHHYDLSGALYDLFLDADRQYSCGYFIQPDDTLEQAQQQKKAHIAAKLCLQPGMTVLDIGSGWGGMALTLARDYGAKVLGVTLSQEQYKRSMQRAAEAGLSDRVSFQLMDYRHLTGTFDRIVSVGMFEHVGVPHYPAYFAQVRNLLGPDGIALIHTIGRAAPPSSTNPWIAKYIFPGGYVPALSEIAVAMEKSGLWPTDIEVWRLHYAMTLAHWLQRFDANIEKIRAIYDDRFCRMWRYYLIASEMTFREGRQCVFQIQLARRQDAVPLTRDYITETSRPDLLHKNRWNEAAQ
ncbi:cyclopropane-fatty-acyl-phospholipid synthase family protein [Cypionkella sp.]|uniref:cyclopropane-fatty-acyl-phospholipid synthase family protein n=1 Tax=Cypionkella sp. TaxID=2811411 RepID=UPI002ABC9B3D|nr:cyclopropane-fatty-acyl-phospholipid synthase family protein [Cypionkella sp.]MDZ4395589.1 cyclopropane-fatty-acyl-phospholipid synthase family protein [Cypionkella sp.]